MRTAVGQRKRSTFLVTDGRHIRNPSQRSEEVRVRIRSCRVVSLAARLQRSKKCEHTRSTVEERGGVSGGERRARTGALRWCTCCSPVLQGSGSRAGKRRWGYVPGASRPAWWSRRLNLAVGVQPHQPRSTPCLPKAPYGTRAHSSVRHGRRPGTCPETGD